MDTVDTLPPVSTGQFHDHIVLTFVFSEQTQTQGQGIFLMPYIQSPDEEYRIIMNSYVTELTLA